MNLYGVKAIYKFEMARMKRTIMQSVLSPVISTCLYFVVFGSAIGARMEAMHGIPYGAFIIPGLIMMALVFGAVGVPLETIAFVAGVDRIMDMMRTTTNVSGDAAVATTVAVMTGEIDTREMISADDV